VRARHLVVALLTVLAVALAAPTLPGVRADRGVSPDLMRAGPAVSPHRARSAVDADQARKEAKRILSEPRFRRSRTPRPFEGLFRRLGRLLVDPVQSFFRRLGRHLPDIGSPPWLIVALAVVTAAAVVTVRLSRDRARERFPRGSRRAAEDRLDPEELERLAEEAERRGELADALRLRFRAGLLRLDGLGAIELRPGLTNAAAARLLRSRRFDRLAVDFDEVVYGGRSATAEDVDEARAAWPRVLEEARG
jgi:Domain of unknown function (DUF4129)